MTTDILTVSYAKDLEWFRWSSLVNQKHLTGWRKWIVICPLQDMTAFRALATERTNMEVRPVEDWPGKGYFWQQAQKLAADTFTDAHFILLIDSDVFVSKPTSVTDYLTDGLPSWLWSYYTDFTGAVPWQAPTQRALNQPAPREFMQGFPFIINRTLFPLVRGRLKHVQGKEVDVYLKECADRGPTEFSEFNVMGCVAFDLLPNDYVFIDRNRQEWPRGYHATRHFWSHAPLADCLPEIQQMLNGGTMHQLEITNMGFWVLSNDTCISRLAKQAGRLDFDTPNLERQCAHIKPGDCVVDVGGLIGDNTLAYARAAAGVDTGQVIAFEPNPTAFEALRRNMAGMSHVQCYNKALGDTFAEMAMAIDQNAGASHLTAGKGVPVIPLDSLELPRLAFMKIDAEGYELRVLQGAEKTIARCRPVMFIEINAGALVRAGTSDEEVFAWLAAHDYRIEGREVGLQYDVYALPN